MPFGWSSLWGAGNTATTSAGPTYSVWSSTPTATATTTWWPAITTSTTSSTLYQRAGGTWTWADDRQWLAQAQQLQQQERWSERAYQYYYQYYQRRARSSLFAPAVVTRQDQVRIDEELYRRAVAEHDEQEAARLLRIVEQHARSNEERLRLLEQQRTAQAEDVERRRAAGQRATQLLRENLTPQQLETFDRNGWFVVEGGRTKQKYRIRSGTMVANVDVLSGSDHVKHRLCGHVPTNLVPHGDQLLAQKIMIELAEDDFLRVANRHAA